MSNKTETASRRLRSDSPIVDAVCRALERTLDSADAQLAVAFAEVFLGKAPSHLLSGRSPDALTQMTLGAYRFLQDSRPDRVDVRVFNPEVEDEGWRAPVTVVRTNVSERPFVVDTIREFLHAQELDIEHIVYPVLSVGRDRSGAISRVAPPSAGGARESLVHCEVTQVTDPDRLELLEAEVARRLQDVVRATDDFPAMVDAINGVVAELAERAASLEDRREEMGEIQDFLRWLRDGGFVLLGYRSYDIVDDASGEATVVVRTGSGLGILRNEGESRFADGVRMSELESGIRDLLVHGPILIINKTNAESTVHRRARMDYIGVKKLGPDGAVTGEHRFVGLFTSKAFAEDAENIPILRRKLSQILGEAGVERGTHDYKEIITIFNSLPKGELFLASAAEVGADVHTVLTTYHTSDVWVTVREDAINRGASVMVIIPRERFSGDVRQEIEDELLETLGGELLSYHLAMAGGDQARLHFYMSADPERVAAVDAGQVRHDLELLIRSWGDRVREGLEDVRSPDESRRLARVYEQAFGAEYQATTDPVVAVDDILELEAMRVDGRDIAVAFSSRRSVASPGVDDVTELRLYLRGEALILSNFMPILESSGLRVIAVNPFEVALGDDGATAIYVFSVQDAQGHPLDVAGCGERVSETILAVRCGDAINDRLNALVLTAGLRWREVDVLRGFTGYAFQIGAVPSRLSLPTALVEHPDIAAQLFQLFSTRFDPASSRSTEERLAQAAGIRADLQEALKGVASLADDRVLRRLEQLIGATVRTNYFRHGGESPTSRSGGVPYISFKFACREMEFLRRTRLLYEVWVHSARMEGVHLRGAKVARGGIRWSDRPDDFRTEILGLVKTQMVKNAVIVPAGSKGGFVVRRAPGDSGERFEQAKAQYQTLIRGLLDLTDNLDADGHTVPADGVVAFDDPDPYLVVAADKGTATFSDLANAVAAEYGFWLGDAFASGGSHGYDHKAVGITARGAWECVKRHFREAGKDIQSEPFTVVGIGDMSGDVFGNGMLLSEQIRLVAAFDHRHVFIDPDPDPASSYAERSRLFALGPSSWDVYDRSVLSEGGMIVPRATKEVELTPQARSALGLEDAEAGTLDGESLIRAVLRAPAELLWNGGIGTYVKSHRETQGEAGDPTNDAVRIDADELRCKVVGEGGNLGLTQRARIEFALAGGRINTDALDNSGGVDMSDHEVNLKILLAPGVADQGMTEYERNTVLEELTEAVAELVLANNRTQSLAVSLDEVRARSTVDHFRDLMFSLEKSGELDRVSEGLPSVDVLVERADRGQTLMRPELCVLLAYAKLTLMSRLLQSGLPDDRVTDSYLRGYFPPVAMGAAGEAHLEAHRLRREIIASQLTNDLVDLMGATFVDRLMRDTGRTTEEIVRSWLVASRLADHRALLTEMAGQRSAMDVRVSYRWLLGLARVLERTTRWVLQNADPDESPAHVVDRSLGGLATLREAFHDVVAGEERDLFEARVREIEQAGADGVFSKRLITLRFLDQLLEIMDVARELDVDDVETAGLYYRVAEAFHVPWLRRAVFETVGPGHWEQRAAQVLSDDLSRAHRRLVAAVASQRADGEDARGSVGGFLRRRERDVERFEGVVSELRSEEGTGLAAISVAVRELSTVADRAGQTQH